MLLRTAGRAVAVGAILLGLGTATPVSAQSDMCLPRARGVPFTNNSPPDWWTAGGQWISQPLADPGWVGATQTTYGAGMGREAMFRGLHHPDQDGGMKLYLSWQLDLALLADGGVIFVGFSKDDDPNHLRIIKLTLEDASIRDHIKPICDKADVTLPHCNAGEATNYRVYAADAALNISKNDAMTGEAQWIHDFSAIWVKDEDGDDVGDQWTFEIRVPIGAGPIADGIELDAGGKVRLWFEARQCQSGACIFAEWPRGADHASEAFGLLTPPPLSQWGVLEPGTSADCPSGIKLSANDVGVLHAAAADPLTAPLTNQIQGVDTATGSAAPNIFVARLDNQMTSAIDPGKVVADFRIADWGSEPITVPRPADWADVPGGIGVPNAAAIAAGATGAIASPSWALSQAERCQYGVGRPEDSCGAATKASHQCILVTLSGPDNYLFENDSVYRNMNFASASTFTRDATISVRGLPPLAGRADRDVYLYVKTRNMPPKYPKPGTKPLDVTLGSLRGHLAEIQKFYPHGKMPRPMAKQFGQLELALRESAARARDPFPSLRRLDPQLLYSIMPTYEVHVFHDTGKTIQVDKETYKVLARQTSFGQFMEHRGVAAGWRSLLDGAERLAPHFYKLAVPQDGTTRVRTTVETIDVEQSQAKPPRKPRTPQESWFEKWRLVIFVGLALALAVLLLARRRRP